MEHTDVIFSGVPIGLVSPEAATGGVTPFVSEKKN